MTKKMIILNYSYFFNIWPWMGLGAAVVVLILLFCTDWLRGDTAKSRWRDPFWLGWAFISFQDSSAATIPAC